MAEKNLKTRIVNKHDTVENWLVSDFIPLKGEIIIYDADSNYPERMKIGDGVNNVNNLPFVVAENLATEEYVAAAIEAIPTPDVSGQINDHNADEASHSDIRAQLSTMAAASDVAELQNLVGDTKVSTQISNAVNPLSSEIANKSAVGHKHTKSEITDFPTAMTPTAHNHSASDINSGTLSGNRLPTVPVTKGGTGATTVAAARTNLGLTTETWTFTLEDGSTVTKAVYVG